MSGGLVWITGLPGVGKSALAAAVAARLRAAAVPVVVLDGDTLRALLGDRGRGFESEQRRELAMTYARLAAWIAREGVLVLAAVVALFESAREVNRAGGMPYVEVWLRAPEALRRQRAGDRDAGGPRVGIELAAEFPRAAHLVLDNDDDPATLARLAEAVVQAWTRTRDGHG